jgi:hypothetical protein
VPGVPVLLRLLRRDRVAGGQFRRAHRGGLHIQHPRRRAQPAVHRHLGQRDGLDHPDAGQLPRRQELPADRRRPAPADFRLAWQDNRIDAFSTWYTTSADGGASWTSQIKLSDRAFGAPYKSAAGYTFPDGDYLGIAVSTAGIIYAIWGEADGSSVYCCGDTWYTRGP